MNKRFYKKRVKTKPQLTNFTNLKDSMTTEEKKYKSWELIISGLSAVSSLGLLLAALFLFRPQEIARTNIAYQSNWENRLAETFYNKFIVYTDSVSNFTSNAEMLRIKILDSTYKDEQGKQLVDNMNIGARKIYEIGNDLQIYTKSLLADDQSIINSIKNVYDSVAKLMIRKNVPPQNIHVQLLDLNALVAEKFNQRYHK